MTTHQRVGFIGLGLMGKPMAHNILKAGFPLTVHNRSRAKVDELASAGATPADGPAEVARNSDVIITCLPGPADVRSIYMDAGGVLEESKPGLVLIEMSTIDVETHKEIAAAAGERGGDYLDAPISGGTAGARIRRNFRRLAGAAFRPAARSIPVLRRLTRITQCNGCLHSKPPFKRDCPSWRSS